MSPEGRASKPKRWLFGWGGRRCGPPRGTSSRRGVRWGWPGDWTKAGGKAARGNGRPGTAGRLGPPCPTSGTPLLPPPATLSRLNGGAVEARPSGDTLSLPAIGGHAAVDAPPGGALSSGSPGLRAPPTRSPTPPLPQGRPGLSPGPTGPQRSLVTCCLAPPRAGQPVANQRAPSAARSRAAPPCSRPAANQRAPSTLGAGTRARPPARGRCR